MRSLRARIGLLAGGLVVAACLTTARGADEPRGQIRDGFESPRTAWSQEQTDTTITLQVHDRSNRAAHEGRLSEHFRFTAGLGSAFYYSYALAKVPVSPDLSASLFVRSSRAGAQIFARIVLPSDIDPDTKQPSFLLVPGTVYDNVDRWQRLDLLDLPASLEKQARVLRASSRRPVKLNGAYVEQIVVNLFAGTGETEAFLDELVVAPVTAEAEAAHARAVGGRLAAGGGSNVPEMNPLPQPSGPSSPAADAGVAAGSPKVILPRNRLKKRFDDGLYRDWAPTAIHAPGADLASLRNAGFDLLIDDLDADPKRFREAVERGFLLMPMIGRGADGAVAEADQVAERISSFPFRDSVVAWHLGDRLGRGSDPRARDDERTRVRALIDTVRSLPKDVSRLTTGTIDDDFALLARAPRGLDLLGVRASGWASSLKPFDTYTYLKQRRDLTVRSNAGAFYWAMLPATAPAAVTSAVWGQDVPPAWGSPTVQAEQLRAMTYSALMAGYRGIAYKGDADLTRGPGRMLLLEMALLNAEIDLFESILANGADPIPVYSAYLPDPPALPPPGGRNGARAKQLKEMPPIPDLIAAGLGTHDRKGVLLVVSDFAPGGQFQPPQMARNDVKLTVIVPEGAQAFQVTPGRLKVLERERGVGGTRLTLGEFDSTALILVTTDVAMAERVEAVVNSIRPRAAQMAIEQAELKLQWVNDTNGRLASDGHPLIEDKERKRRESNGGPLSTDAADLLNKAGENVKAARENLEREDFSAAWDEARRASRPMRILMRGLWDNANAAMVRANMEPDDVANEELIRVGRAKRKGPPLLVPPVASAPLASFNTLPQHYLWVDWMQNARFGRNLVPSGTFDDAEGLEKAGWADQAYLYEGVTAKVATVPVGGGGTRRLIRMTVEPTVKGTLDDLPPFLDFPAAAIRSPAVKVRAGQFLRITVAVQRPIATARGAGGVFVRDSIGGEALQFVSNEPIPAMTKLVLFRRAPADGELSVTLGLAGYGDVYFDEFSVERVEAAGGPGNVPGPPDVAETPRPRPPEVATPATARGTGGSRSNR